jgi:antirestriction protein
MEKTEYEKLLTNIVNLLQGDDNKTHFTIQNGDERPIALYCMNHSITTPNADTLTDVEEAYCGEYRNGTEFAEELVDDTGMLSNVPDNIRFYFDYEAFGRDLFMGDYWIEDGHVFRNF